MRIAAFVLTLLLFSTSVQARDPQEARGRNEHWIGKTITIKAANIEVADLLRLIAEASGFNLVLGDGVQGTVRAISWEDVPWDQALDMLLKTKHLKAERSGNMLRVEAY